MGVHDRFEGRATFAAAAIAVAVAVSSASVAVAQIMGMPGLDATKPLGQPSAPGAADAPTSTGEETLPSFTEAQVERGRDEYMDNCAECHGDELDNGEFGGAPLTGSYFDDHWSGLPVSALYGFMSSAMPPNRPGALSPQTYADITAFILDQNGYDATGEELPTDLDALDNMVLSKD